ncbi:MAG TPA: PilT/PilU family type 4a pilus ATPase [Candidatus Sumerlaeota bacterium]|nr:PilT/PilU family type 4a pilus ATPase [Candidatus Sumerlaeota bacterium]
MPLNFRALLEGAVKNNASDVHMMEDVQPFFRIRGDLKRVETPPLTAEDMRQLLHETMPEHLKGDLEANYHVDYSYEIPNVARFRVVVYFQTGRLCSAFRSIPMKIPTIDELKHDKVVARIAENHRGMVLVTGITGSGKSTTLAAMINHINTHEARRIIAIEDPVEFRYTNIKSLISQREVGSDVGSFADALRSALRADPDVILVGEMRDVETIRIAIKATETGHLVFSTLHTRGAVHTIQRILGNFEQSEHDMLRDQLSLNMLAAMTQRLVKTADGKGRRAAVEIMVNNGVVAKLIRENRIADIQGYISSREEGMRTMDQALADLVRAKEVAIEEAQIHCNDFYALKRAIAGGSASGDKGGIIG